MSINLNYIRDHFNQGAEVVYTDHKISLDQFTSEAGFERIDVLKIDTDGADFGVLLSARQTFEKARPLWVQVETNLAESGALLDSAFCDVDRFMRELGYTLIDLTPWRYSRSALPQPFAYDIAAQTISGPVAWADAVYVDDPLRTADKLDQWLKTDNGLRRAARLACLYDVYGFSDCAAELLAALRVHPASASKADWRRMLDLLTPTEPFGTQDYESYLAAFAADPEALFPKRSAPAPVALSSAYLQMERDLAVALRNIERRKRRMMLLSTRMVAAQAETERFRARLSAVELERAGATALANSYSEQIIAMQAEMERRQAAAATELQHVLDKRSAEITQREAAHAAAIHDISTAADQRFERLVAEYAAEAARLEAKHAAALDAVRTQAAQEHADAVTRLSSAHRSAMQELISSHRNAVRELTIQFKDEREALTAALTSLRADAAAREVELIKLTREADERWRAAQFALDGLRERTSTTQASILAAAREAWSLDPDERGDVFEVLSRAKRLTRELRERHEAAQIKLARAESIRMELTRLLHASGRFTLRRMLAALRRRDLFKSLPHIEV